MKLYDDWNNVKKEINSLKVKFGIRTKDICWVKVGRNIGSEEYGKGSLFLRPTIIVKQLTSDLFIGIPTTTIVKENNDYFHNINYVDKYSKNKISSYAMIYQFRTFSKKRLLNKIGVLGNDEFNMIINKMKLLIDPTH